MYFKSYKIFYHKNLDMSDFLNFICELFRHFEQKYLLYFY